MPTFEWASAPDTGQVVHATWQGKNLVADLKTPRGGAASQTFELSADGKTLTVVMHMERRDGEAVELTSRYTKFEGEKRCVPSMVPWCRLPIQLEVCAALAVPRT